MGRYSSFTRTCAALLFLLAAAAPGLAGTTELVSVSNEGVAFRGWHPCISADGRYIAFTSDAEGLVPDDTNGHLDAFLRDTVAGTTQRISLSSTGEQLSLGSVAEAISADGRYLLVKSDGPDVLPGVAGPQLYLYDLQAGAIEVVSVNSVGEPAVTGTEYAAFTQCTLSPNGRYVAMGSTATNLDARYTVFSYYPQIYLRDRVAGTTELVSATYFGDPVLSGNYLLSSVSDVGPYVTFYGPPLWVVEGVTDVHTQVLLRDCLAETTEVVSENREGEIADAGSVGGGITPDGRYIVFASWAANLVPGETNGVEQIYLRDLVSGAVDRVSVNGDGEQANDYLNFWQQAVSNDGRWVAFQSWATNLVPDDTNGCEDIFVRDRATGATIRVDVSSDGEQADREGGGSSVISANGRYVVFQSGATNLAPSAVDGQLLIHDLAGPFNDVWETDWSYASVRAVAAAGIARGYDDGAYRPTAGVTRDQMAVYLARALAGGDAYVPTSAIAADFTDVPADHWAFPYVEYVVGQGVVGGYDDGSYRPAEPVDRAQMAVFVARSLVAPQGEAGLAGYTPPTAASFTDVPTDFWAYKHVEYCKAQGIVSGYGDDYRPADAVTRDQMAVYITRAFGLEG
jgi:Tol biopolymer transport system component